MPGADTAASLLDLVNLSMGFRIVTVGLEIRGYGIDLLIECLYFEINKLYLFRQFFTGILYLLTKDLMPL